MSAARLKQWSQPLRTFWQFSNRRRSASINSSQNISSCRGIAGERTSDGAGGRARAVSQRGSRVVSQTSSVRTRAARAFFERARRASVVVVVVVVYRSIAETTEEVGHVDDDAFDCG
jgi:hypothetical protein